MFRKIHKRIGKIESRIRCESEELRGLKMRLYAVEDKTKITQVHSPDGLMNQFTVRYQTNEVLCMLLDYLNVTIVHTDATTKIAKTKETNDEA